MMVGFGIAYWVAVALLCATVAAQWVGRTDRRVRLTALALGLSALTVSIVLRWVVTGHPPIFGTFENTLASAWFLVIAVMLLETRDPGLARAVGLWLPVTLAYGLFFSLEPLPLTISERSLWVDAHALLAWLAYTLLLVVGTAAVLRLLPGDRSTEWFDALIVPGLGIGFALLTGMIAVGAIYRYLLFAEWWGWEIVETLAAMAWLAYGLTLHARLLSGWRDVRLAWCAVGATVLLIAVMWSWSVYTGTYHHFDFVPVRATELG